MKQGAFSLNNLINVNEQTREFHLTNGHISYIFRVMPELNQLESVYFGKAVHVQKDLHNLDEYEPGSGCQQLPKTGIASLEHRRQEYPTYGTTDFRKPAFEIKYPSGDKISAFKYLDYTIEAGAPDLGVMPHVRYAQNAQTLSIRLKDNYSKLYLTLNYTIFSDLDIIVRNAVFENQDSKTYSLLAAKSASLDLPTANYDLITLNGAWARERHVNRTPLRPGLQEIGSIRGATGHIHDPFVALAQPNTTQNLGEAIGMTLMYSGNHQESIDVNTYGVTRIMTGISDADFNWKLEAGKKFITPQAVFSYSDRGLNGLSHNYHDLIRQHIINKEWQTPQRPVLINNWEATYYDFNEEKLLTLAKNAKEIGCDLFVLDDGWFGHSRMSDTGYMGDWEVDPAKLPNGLDHLVKKIRDLDMKFGIWFEPEALSMDTKLYQDHPDWLLGNPNKHLSQGRNQYLVDFANPDAVEALYQKMVKIIDQVHPDYIKWDMNRNITEPYSNYLSADKQGEVFHRYIMGVYRLYQKLTNKYPNILFESCAGGGGRFDLAMFYYAPQAWTSDDTDAYERWQIQTGTSYVYPPAVMGAHVSIVPNHQTGRITPLKTRANIAMFGSFGYEFDLTKLSTQEKEELKQATKRFHQFHDLIFNGDFYRLEPSNPKHGAWQVSSKDKKHAVVCYFYGLSEPNHGYYHLKLTGLDPDQLYEVNDKRRLYGDELMNIGLPLTEDYHKHEDDYWSKPMMDFDSKLFEIKAI